MPESSTDSLRVGIAPSRSQDPPPVAASAWRAERAERLHASIRALATDNGLTIAELSRLIGLNTPNVFYNLLNRRSEGLSHSTLARLCDAFPGTTLDQIVGRTPAPRLPETQTEPPPGRAHDDQAGASVLPGSSAATVSKAAAGPPGSGELQIVSTSFREISRKLQALRVGVYDIERCRARLMLRRRR